MKTLAFRSGGSHDRPYFVLAHTVAAPDPEEWQQYVSAVAEVMTTVSATMHVFVATDGGSPNPAQRKQLAAAFGSSKADSWTHVFTTDSFIRGVVTAFRWIARAHATAHAPEDFPRVCNEYGVSPIAVLRDFTEAQKLLPRVNGISRLEYALERESNHPS